MWIDDQRRQRNVGGGDGVIMLGRLDDGYALEQGYMKLF